MDDDFEEASGRATRARTRLIVEGYSNLALIAILFTGVQAQLISVTNEQNDSALEIATNAVFFGGLMFSVFTAVLAVLSGRWFSILREDDSDYLSSRWLAQDCAGINKSDTDIEQGGSDKRQPDLDQYLEFQITSLRAKLEQFQGKHSNQGQRHSVADSGRKETGSSGGQQDIQVSEEPQPETDASKKFNPNEFDIKHILMLLERERSKHAQVCSAEGEKSTPPQTIETAGATSAAAGAGMDGAKDASAGVLTSTSAQHKLKKPKNLAAREWILSRVLLSPIAVAVPAFVLFCAGILMLAWNKQPRAVAIFTSAAVLICVLLFAGFFVQHRRKHVIRNLYLGRPSF